METVKVDMQKLQLLNERIAQTIDALNQLRLSVHGIQHTPAGVGFGGFGFYNPSFTPGFSSGYGYNPSYSQGYSQGFNPMSFVQPPFVPYGAGIQHTTPPWTQTPVWTQVASPSWVQPHIPNGLSHTTWEPTWR